MEKGKGKRNKGNRMPGARGSLLRGLPLLAHHSRRRHRPLLLLFIAVPIFLHRRRRAPTDLDLDGRFLPTQGCYRLPRLKGVGLSGARLVVRHPHDRGLSIREDAGPCRACVAWPVPLSLPKRARWPRSPRRMLPRRIPCGLSSQPISFTSSTLPRIPPPQRGDMFGLGRL